MFEEIPNRDAWSVIRGFVYQVDITILKWLALEGNEALELEKGEDIDVVNYKIANKEVRELNQVKFREDNITLTSPEVLESIANFFRHRRNNKSIKLKFRFVTNTKYSIERPSLFPNDGKGGIETWIDLQKESTLQADDKRLKKIRSHLLKKCLEAKGKAKRKAEDENEMEQEDSFAEFAVYLANGDDSDFKELVLDFEWAARFDDNIEITSTVRDKLVLLGVASNDVESSLYYNKLFVFVFKLLSQKSEKRLTKSDLSDQILDSALNNSDAELFSKIEQIFSVLERRIERLEKKNVDTQNDISSLIRNFDQLAIKDAVFNYGLKNISTVPPSPIFRGSLRSRKVDEILRLFNNCTWININGLNGTGKSQLAIRTAQRFSGVWWIDVRNYDTEQKTLIIIEELLKSITKKHFNKHRVMWIHEVSQKIPENSIIILNDIPRITTGSQLADLLIKLGMSLFSRGIKILTTSNFPIQAAIRSALPGTIFAPYNDLDFNDFEIAEFLKNNEAPDSILNYSKLIAAVSSGNPRLISAIVNHLKAINWGEDSKEVFDVVFNREFTSEILEDTQHSISQYITDIQSRELLYRLSLLKLNFDMTIVKAVGEIANPIEHVGEKLQSLTNVWIQKYDDHNLQISPLVRDIGKHNLKEDTIKEVYNTAAEAIISEKQLNEITAANAISLFIDGKDYDKAGSVLIMVLHSAKTIEEMKALEKWSYLLYWYNIDIPNEISLSHRIMIRNEQLRISYKLQKSGIFYKEQLIKYTKEEDDTSINRYMSYLSLIGYYDDENLSEFWKYCRKLVEVSSKLGEPYKAMYETKEDNLSSLIWMQIRELKSIDDLKEWIEVINFIEKSIKQNPLDDKISQSAITVLCTDLVKVRNEKGETREIFIAKLELLVSCFSEKGEEALTAIVLREILWNEYHNIDNKSSVLVKANEVISKFVSKDAQFIICECIGRLLYESKEIIQSRDWLERAVGFDLPTQDNYTEILIYAAAAITDIDKAKALEYCLRAIQIADAKEFYTDIDYVYVLAELAIAYWINSENIKSFETFELAVNKLFESKKEVPDDRWTRYIVIIGNCIGYISRSVQGQDYIDLKSQEMTRPYQGIFFSNNPKIADRYSVKKEPLIVANLAIFADVINDKYKAYQWSLRAFDMARKNSDEPTLIMISSVCSQYSLINFKVAEALESYLLASAVSVHIEGTPEEKVAIYNQISLKEILSDKPSIRWDTAEEITSQYAIIPLFVMLLTSKLNAEEYHKEYYKTYITALSDYKMEASKPVLWEIIIELSGRIINEQIPETQLSHRANTFGDQKRKSEQIFCILGVIYLSDDCNKVIILLLNILPYLVKSYRHQSILKYVVVPFMKSLWNSKLLKHPKENVDIEKLKLEIASISDDAEHAAQLILQIFVKHFNTEIVLEDRKRWLYNFEEI